MTALPYQRGELLPDTASDLRKLERAWQHIRSRGTERVYNLSGLVRSQPPLESCESLDDDIAAALYVDALREQGLEHLGGDPDRHDVLLVNRTTGGLWLAAEHLIERGRPVLGVSPRYSHPAVVRAVANAGGVFTDVAGADPAISRIEADRPQTVFITRLSVSYEILASDELQRIVEAARRAGARIIVDDAGGARVGPAVFDQPRSLELDVDVAVTGLDKYGTVGPRLGLLGGRTQQVESIRARAFEMGLEARPMLYPAAVKSLRQYDPATVNDLVERTLSFATVLKDRLGAEHVLETAVTAQLRGETILELAMNRSGANTTAIVAYEATAALAMILLRNAGILTVHFAGIPPGTSALMFKFLPGDEIERLGGIEALASCVDEGIDTLAGLHHDRSAMRELLFGSRTAR